MISEKIPSQSLPLGSLGHGPQESPETNPNGEIVCVPSPQPYQACFFLHQAIMDVKILRFF